MLVALSGAYVHDVSREAKAVLHSIPNEGFTMEAERLLTQIETDEIVLTGWKFFSLTKSTILKVIKMSIFRLYPVFIIR